MSSYTANLAAVYTTTAPPVQPITGLASFATAGNALCVRSSSTLSLLLQSNYPAVWAQARCGLRGTRFRGRC